MALGNKQKNKMRLVIRVTMVTIAAILLFWALVLPVINNAVALGIENELKEDLAGEEHLTIIDSISAAGRFSPFTKDMQYFGAVLVQSDLSDTELETYFEESLFWKQYNCSYQKQTTAEITLNKIDTNVTFHFDDFSNGTYYIIYRWDQPPGWVRPLLNTDMR